ncbi:MAG: hypothetical protein H0X37_27415 [Herpetosiphonaceae bacterium]|nr:hypothetical protein [Herpetosiphonaceae bacterium]
MFNGKGKGTSRSARAQAHGRAELQRQLEERLIYWRLFLEAKLEELHERRNPAGLQEAPSDGDQMAPGDRLTSGTAALTDVQDPSLDDGALELEEDA